MNKTALKSFAEYSRERLIKDVKAKARLIGIREEGIESPLSESTNDMYAFDIGQVDTYRIYGEDVRKYGKLIKELEKREEESDYKIAYTTLVEEVAYTWFNRIIAIRFMEVNNYMPDRMRVLSSGKEGVREPEFVTYYRDTNIGIKEDEFVKLDELKLDASAQAMDELFQFMFIKQCNALNENLPELFEKTDDYTELLLNISYNDEEGVVYKLIEDIGEEAFDISRTGQIEVIGWLYQYYNTVPKQKVDKSKKKVDKNTLPAKTQLFTPEWIVKYMVQNSLGRLWIERKIARGSNKSEKELAKEYEWKYYIEEAEQIEEVEVKLKDIIEDRKNLKVEDITFIDPSMGSGHILVYAFEVFMQFYLEEGYTEREAAESIIENNLYGLDIDKRAYQLAYFALMMKGREYSRRILNKNLKNNLYYFIDSRDVNLKQIDLLGGNIEDQNIKQDIKEDIFDIVELFRNGRELGSIIKLDRKYNFEYIREYILSIDKDVFPLEIVGIEYTQINLESIIRLLEVMSSKYHVVVTNPPYLGLRKMNTNMKNYVEKNYTQYKYDLFSVFIKQSFDLLEDFGLLGLMTSDVWEYIDSYKYLREYIIDNHGIINFLELEKGSFKEASVDIITFIARKNINYSNSKFIDLNINKHSSIGKNRLENSTIYFKNIKDFKRVPGCNFAYWVGEKTIENFRTGKKLEKIGFPRQGMATTDNNRFLRNWYEVSYSNINLMEIEKYMPGYKWYPYNKGGGHRNWYGNNLMIINWENDGYEVKNLAKLKYGSITRTIKNQKFYFREGITYSFIGITISARITGKGYLFDVAGSTIFLDDYKYLEYLLGLLYSVVSDHYMGVLNPTINIQVGDIKDIPVILDNNYKVLIDNLVQENIFISKIDWDSFETSWDFEVHPLLDFEKQTETLNRIELAYKNWKEYANNNFTKLKENEEKLNEIFIEIYGLEDELNPEVLDKDITIAKIFDHKNEVYEDIKGNRYILTKEDVIKSFISYGVGCIFGRYSLDEKGLVYAGGEFDINRYKKFKPVEDNIVIITDEEYFEDDLVNKFVDFVRVSFGEENLEENLNFIADSLKGKGTPREKIRNYFINDFYSDHVKRYKKTPIYWLYDSSAGKTKRQSQNGFKALVYMHRYDADTTGKVRIDYLHKLQRVYESRIDFLRDDIANNNDAKEVAKSEEELERIMKQIKECKDYDPKIAHLALSRIDIDLDDGVKVNYEKIQTDEEGEKYKILAKL